MDSLLPPVNLGSVNVYLKLFIVPNGTRDMAVGDPKEGDQDCCFISVTEVAAAFNNLTLYPC